MTNEEKMALRIRQKRKEIGYTMEQLGEVVGVQKSAVNKWEKGNVTNIKRSVIKKMSDLFDCSPVWLMGYDVSETLEIAKEDAIHDAELIKNFHKLNDRDKAIIKNMIDSMLSE